MSSQLLEVDGPPNDAMQQGQDEEMVVIRMIYYHLLIALFALNGPPLPNQVQLTEVSASCSESPPEPSASWIYGC